MLVQFILFTWGLAAGLCLFLLMHPHHCDHVLQAPGASVEPFLTLIALSTITRKILQDT